MKAVNLLPADARRSRTASGGRAGFSTSGFGPAGFVVVLLLVVVALILLRVLSDNDVNNKKATLAAAQAQVAAEQAEAAKLTVYVNFIAMAQAQKQQVQEIAEQRFPWRRTLDQISHVLPASTSLTSLGASTAAPTTTSTAGATVSGPTFSLAGCADTPNQNGVATLLRRLTVLTGVSNVGFENSTRTVSCGNSFSLVLSFAAPGTGATTTGSTTAIAGTTTSSTTTTAPTTTSTTTPATTG
jgi:Tfp pilus assembly protein PilN